MSSTYVDIYIESIGSKFCHWFSNIRRACFIYINSSPALVFINLYTRSMSVSCIFVSIPWLSISSMHCLKFFKKHFLSPSPKSCVSPMLESGLCSKRIDSIFVGICRNSFPLIGAWYRIRNSIRLAQHQLTKLYLHCLYPRAVMKSQIIPLPMLWQAQPLQRTWNEWMNEWMKIVYYTFFYI